MKKKQPDFHILLLRRGFFYPLYSYDHHSVHTWHLAIWYIKHSHVRS